MQHPHIKRIHETLFILHKCASTVNRVYEAYEEHREKGILHSFVHFSHNLYYYTIMEAVSFLEEYDSFFTEANVESQYKQRVRDVRRVVKPLYRKIREWKDLKLYRNRVVAHGWRDEKNGNHLTVPHKKHYDVPRTHFELQLLRDLIKQLMDFIETEFHIEAGWAGWYGYEGEKEERALKDYSNINAELQTILDQMNATAKELGKDYDIRISGYKWPEKTEAENEAS